MRLAIGCALGLVALASLWGTWPRRAKVKTNRRRRPTLMLVERSGNVHVEYVEVMR